MNPLPTSLMRVAWTAALAFCVGLSWLVMPSIHEPSEAQANAESEWKIKQQHKKTRPTAQLKRAEAKEQSEALEQLMAGKPFVLVADGRPQRFNLSLRELYLPTAPADQRLCRIEPQNEVSGLLKQARQLGGEKVGWVLYPVGKEGQAHLRKILHKRIHIQTGNREATLALLPKLGLQLISEPDYSPGSLIVEPVRGGPEATLQALAVLAKDASIRQVGPLLMRQMQKHLIPNDSFFSQQWHLRNTGQGGGKSGVDLKLTSVWDTYRGQGVKIAIVDDGLDLLHPDLAPNADSANHFDWNDLPPDTNPAPVAAFHDDHGTAVGGVAAARGNNSLGVSGVAPEATLVGFRLISSATDDEQDADAMSRGKDVIQIKNNSWGTGAFADQTVPAGQLMEAARQDAAMTGRNGRGTLFVWSAGNGRDNFEQGQKDGSTNSMFITTVGSLTNKGDLAVYSETGSHLVTVVPSNGGTRSIYTTDLRGADGFNKLGTTEGEPGDLNYTSSFGGTSSSAPALSGMMALMLQANPNLNWRDVKEILLRSSVKIVPLDTGWVSRAGGLTHVSPIEHHQSFGGGQADAAAAVTMSIPWKSLGPMITESRSTSVVRSIPDNSSSGISSVFDFSSIEPLRVEHVTVKVRIFHSYRGDLEIKLTSPAGTVSTLASKELADNGEDYDDWVFSSVRHWGEAANGLWILSIKDLSSKDTGTLQSATISLFGTHAPAITAQTTAPQLLTEGDPLTVSIQTTAAGDLKYEWFRDEQLQSTETDVFSVGSVTTAHAGTYRVNASNSAGADTSAPIQVAIVNRTLAAQTVTEGKTLTLQTNSRGPALTYQWKRNGTLMTDGGRISGTTARTLTVNSVNADDAAEYSCVIGMTGVLTSIETLPAIITIGRLPVIHALSWENGIVSGNLSRTLSADHAPIYFTAYGLPPGVRFNATTGQISGRPVIAGDYTFTITATNVFGTSAPLEIDWHIEDFPAAAVGTWTGLVERDDLNAGHGGRLRFTIGSTGIYSGQITLGSKNYSWSGQIDAVRGSSSLTTPFSISRGFSQTALTGNFNLHLTSGTLTGTVTDGTASAELEAVLQSWSGTNRPVTQTAVYNAALEVPGEHLDDPLYPQGHGHLRLLLGLSGSLYGVGRLADGTSMTSSAALGPAGQAALHTMLYGGGGSAQGWSTVTLATGLLDGSLDWRKMKPPETSTTRSYKDGIPLHTLNVRGARYVRPASGSMVIGLPPQPQTGPLVNNARLLFTGLPLTTTLEQLFPINQRNLPIMPLTSALNPKVVRLSLNATTGALTGTFTFKDPDPFDTIPPIAQITRNGTISGLLVTRPGLTQGIGFFLLPELPDLATEKSSTTPVVSGKAELVSP